MAYPMPASNTDWPPIYMTMSQGPPMASSYAMSSAGYGQALTIECPTSNPYYPYSPSLPYQEAHQFATYPSSHSPVSTHSTASYSPSPSEGYVSPASVYTPPHIPAEGTRCHYQDCTSTGKFKRRTDLDRHIRTQHEADKHRMNCSHSWCGRTGKNGFSRLDHLREHLREVHRQDIPFKTRRSRSPTKTKNRRSTGGNNGSKAMI